MTKDTQPEQDQKISSEELDHLDANLLEIETLYRSRCITPRTGNNVIVREIDENDQ